MTVTDSCGNLHDTRGKFAGRVQTECDPDDILAVLEAERAAQQAVVDDFELTRARITRAVKALDRQTGKTRSDHSIDLEDVIQDVHLAFLQAKANGIQIEREDAVLNAIARAKMREVGMSMTTENRAANIQLNRWKKDFLATEQREPTQNEINAEAEQIRDNWHDPRHRPSRGFHLWIRAAALGTPLSINPSDREGFDEVSALISSKLSVEDHPFNAPPQDTPWAEVAESCVSHRDFSDGTLRDARTFLYPAMAQMGDAPLPVLGSLSKASVRAARTAVEDAGGVAAVVAKFRAGHTGADVEALFRPWSSSPTSHSDRERIVAVLTMQPEGEEDMWSSALKFSSREHLARINQVVAAWKAEPESCQGAA